MCPIKPVETVICRNSVLKAICDEQKSKAIAVGVVLLQSTFHESSSVVHIDQLLDAVVQQLLQEGGLVGRRESAYGQIGHLVEGQHPGWRASPVHCCNDAAVLELLARSGTRTLT